MPTSRRTLLLDHHGVISDGERMPGEWRRLLGEFLTPRFGATPQVWADGNRVALARSVARYDAHGRDGSRYGREEFTRNDRIEWMRDMLAFAGVPVPDDATLLQAAIEATRYVTLRAQAPVPGAATTLRALHDHGFRLFTASGDLAENLSNYLTALGVRGLFAQTYGADLLGVGKTGPGFYTALLAHAALDPADAVVVDDDAHRLDWARSLGMETVLVGRKDPGAGHPRVVRFADLPSVLL